MKPGMPSNSGKRSHVRKTTQPTMPSNSAKKSQVLHNNREQGIDCSSSGRVAPQRTTYRTSTILVQTHSAPRECNGNQCLSVCRTSPREPLMLFRHRRSQTRSPRLRSAAQAGAYFLAGLAILSQGRTSSCVLWRLSRNRTPLNASTPWTPR